MRKPYRVQERVVRKDMTDRGKDMVSVLLDLITSAWGDGGREGEREGRGEGEREEGGREGEKEKGEREGGRGRKGGGGEEEGRERTE